MEHLIYNGVDISNDISIQSAIHDMRCDNQGVDSIDIICNDPTGQWSKWGPKQNDTVEFKYGSMTTGKMFLRSFRAENGSFCLFATSMPVTFNQAHDRKWNDTALLGVARQIASEHGLNFKSFGVADVSYKDIRQKNQTDFSFLRDLAMLEGCYLLCYDGALIMASGTWMDTQSAVMDFEIGINGKFSYSDSSGSGAGSCTVSRTWNKVIHKPETKGEHAPMGSGAHEHEHDKDVLAVYTGVYKPNDSLGTAKIEMDLPVRSNTEASRFAKGICRSKNAFLKKGRFNKGLVEGLAPGSAINVKTEKAGKWNGKMIVYRVRNNYVKNVSTVFFRHPLSGY